MQFAQPRRQGLDVPALLSYVANLELEVDRLRREGQFMQHQLRGTLKWVRSLSSPTSVPSDLPLAEINRAAEQLAGVLRDLQESPTYHPADDQVIAIAVRPFVERIFRWQQHLQDAADVELRLELATDHMDWFPGRLRHILDTLFSNALKYRDEGKGQAWVRLELKPLGDTYELRVSDNGIGLAARRGTDVFELIYRAAARRDVGVSVGLAVVKVLIEQSGGSLTVSSGEGQGTDFVAVLPRYNVADFLT